MKLKIIQSKKNTSESESEETEQDEDHPEEPVELSGLSTVQLLKLLKDKIQTTPILRLDKIAHEIKAAFDELISKEKEEALAKFKAEGGTEEEFEYRHHEEEREFLKVFNDFRYQLNSLRKEAERQKEKKSNSQNGALEQTPGSGRRGGDYAQYVYHQGDSGRMEGYRSRTCFPKQKPLGKFQCPDG